MMLVVLDWAFLTVEEFKAGAEQYAKKFMQLFYIDCIYI